jgi:hypothetical protein
MLRNVENAFGADCHDGWTLDVRAPHPAGKRAGIAVDRQCGGWIERYSRKHVLTLRGRLLTPNETRHPLLFERVASFFGVLGRETDCLQITLVLNGRFKRYRISRAQICFPVSAAIGARAAIVCASASARGRNAENSCTSLTKPHDSARVASIGSPVINISAALLGPMLCARR